MTQSENDNKPMSDEIGQMIDFTTENPVVEPAEPSPEPQAQVAEPVAESTTPVVEPAQATAPTQPEPVQESELEFLKRRNDELMQRLEEVSSKALSATTVQVPKATQAVVTEVANAIQESTYIDPEKYVELLEDPKAFNALLNKIRNDAIDEATKRVTEKVLLSVPELTVNYVNRHTTLTKAVDKFYNDNPELTTVKAFVGTVANEVQAEHPEWGVEQIFSETAVRAKKSLNLTTKVIAPQSPTNQPARPAFAKTSGASGGSGRSVAEPSLKGLAKEIDDMLAIS